MHIAVIGAGIAGLGVARALDKAGQRVTVFEKKGDIGGRLATRHVTLCGADVTFDYGAQNIKAPGCALDLIARELLAPEEIISIPQPVWLHDGERIYPGDAATNAEPKWTCRSGLSALAEALASGLELRLNTPIQRLDEKEGFVSVLGTDGNSLGAYDRVILTLPLPQCVDLIPRADARVGLAQSTHFRSCLSVMLWFERPSYAPWYALLAMDRAHPLLWLAHANLGGDAAVGTGLVAQLGPDCSHRRYQQSDNEVIGATNAWVSAVLGPTFATPAWSTVERWYHAQPESMADFEAINPPGSRIVLCGDGLAGGKAHLAYESGLQAARFILDG